MKDWFNRQETGLKFIIVLASIMALIGLVQLIF